MALKKWVNTNVGSSNATILTVGTGNTAVIFGIKRVSYHYVETWRL